jgi:hypothetical protein
MYRRFGDQLLVLGSFAGQREYRELSRMTKHVGVKGVVAWARKKIDIFIYLIIYIFL